MSTISSFRSLENKYDEYRGKDCMTKFCKSLREQAMELINFKKNKTKSLANKQQKSYQNAKIGDIFMKKNMIKIKNILKPGTIVIIQENIEVLRVAYLI